MDELDQLNTLLLQNEQRFPDPELRAQQEKEQEEARKQLSDLVQAQEAETGERSPLRDLLGDPAFGGTPKQMGPDTTYSESVNPAFATPDQGVGIGRGVGVTQDQTIELPQVDVTPGAPPIQVVEPEQQGEPDISEVLANLTQTQQEPDQLIPPPDYPGAPTQYAKDKAQSVVSGISQVFQDAMDTSVPDHQSDEELPPQSNLGITDKNISGAAQLAQLMTGLKGGSITKNVVQQGLITPEAKALQSLSNPIGSADARERETAADRRARLAADAASRAAQGLPPIDYRTAREKQRDAANAQGKQYVIDSIGGPINVPEASLKTLGGLVFVSVGAAFAPKIFKNFKMGVLPRLPNFERPVKVAKPGTIALSTPTDLARTYDDVNAGVMRIGKRYIMTPGAIQEVEKVFQLQTRGAAHSLTDSAVTMGRAEVPNFAFQSKVPLGDLAKLDSPQVRDYLHAWDTADDLLIQINKRTPTQNAQFGPPTVRGQTLADVTQQITALERANPQLRQIGAAYKDIVKSIRRFEGEGEYATKSRKTINKLNTTRPNEVPWNGPAVTGRPVDRGNPFGSLKTSMKADLRKRMENEAKGKYVDAMLKDKPGSFVRTGHDELKANPDWEKNTVTIWRRGKVEHYTTDPYIADIFRMDPYYLPQGLKQIYALKRVFESQTTGLLAPWFAPMSLIRNYIIAKQTAPTIGKGLTSPNAVQTLTAIPRQLFPQIAHNISESLNRGNGQWLNRVFGPGFTNAMSTRLAQSYTDSMYYLIATSGSSRSSIMQHQMSALGNLQSVIDNAQGPLKAILNGYKELLQAVHNAPSFAYAVRNKGKVPLPELAGEARRLTGDNRIGGQFFNTGTGPIRFEGGGFVSHTLGKAVQGYGALTEAGRVSVPWWNATTQGIKRIGESYLENPVTFTGRMWLYGGMPAASLYAFVRGLDKDPNGQSYVDYMMNRRSEYNKTMSLYIPIPEKPAEEGIEFPVFQELSPMTRMMQVAMDHAFGSALFSEKEDFLSASSSFLSTVIEPPMPPLANVALASQGMSGPMGAFTGEAYKRRTDPYDQTGGLPASIELYARAVSGGLADVIGSGYAAFTQTPKGVMTGIENAISESAKRVASKTPIVRNIAGTLPPVSGNTNITQKLFEKQRAIDQLTRHFQKWGGDQQISTKPASAAGGGIADALLGPNYPGQENKTPAAGLNQPEPTNPLYTMLMQEIWNKFRKDAPKLEDGQNVGGIGFRSLWHRYGDATEELSRLRNINDGNAVTWQKQMQDRTGKFGTDIPAWLKDNNVDTTNRRQVQAFFEKSRQDAARTILFLIRGVEHDIGERPAVKQLLGDKPFTIEMLDPYKAGIDPSKDPRTDPEVAKGATLDIRDTAP